MFTVRYSILLCYFQVKNQSMSESKKILTLTPSWKNYFWGYFFGFLLLPVLVGIIILWLTNKNRKSLCFEISNTSIAVIQDSEKQKLYLVDILSTSVEQSKLQSLFNIGDIHLQANVSTLVLTGIEEPKVFLDKIDTAIAYQKEQLKASEKVTAREPTHDPGTLDKLDYLTGLWQQGLITDEDYDSERKKFE